MRRSPRIATVSLLATTLIAAACGDSGDDDAGSATQADRPAAEASPSGGDDTVDTGAGEGTVDAAEPAAEAADATAGDVPSAAAAATGATTPAAPAPGQPARASAAQTSKSRAGKGAAESASTAPPADRAPSTGNEPSASEATPPSRPGPGGSSPAKPSPSNPANPAPAPAPGSGPEVLRLGGVFPLSGPLGSVGTAMMQGIQAVLTDVNEGGGVNGTRLELRVEDDQFDPVRGKALVQKLINEDKVFALAGIFSPFTIQAALPDIRAAKIPLVSPSGSDDREFDEPMLFPVTNPCGRQMAGNVQHLVKERKLTKLAVVYVNVEAVANCTKYFTAVADKLGAEVVFESATGPAAPDCASRILSARASGAEALIVIVDNLGVVKCVQAQRQQNWDVPVSISYNIVDDPTLLDGLGDAAEGLLSSSPFSGGSTEPFERTCGAVRRYYPKAKVQFFMIVGCLGANLLTEGLRLAGTGSGRQALIDVLESGRVFSFGGLVPDLSYEPGRHLPYDLTATVEVKDGRWVRVGSLYTPVKP